MNDTGQAFSLAMERHDMPCTKASPTQWWMFHGYEMLKLKDFAIRVLSQGNNVHRNFEFGCTFATCKYFCLVF